MRKEENREEKKRERFFVGTQKRCETVIAIRVIVKLYFSLYTYININILFTNLIFVVVVVFIGCFEILFFSN